MRRDHPGACPKCGMASEPRTITAGEGSPLMIWALLELGDYEQKRGRPAEAEKVYREAVQLARTFNRVELGRTARSRLIELLREQSRYNEADAPADPP